MLGKRKRTDVRFPEDVHRLVEERAQLEHRSFNGQVIHLLVQALGPVNASTMNVVESQ